jgi:hypothetical protein
MNATAQLDWVPLFAKSVGFALDAGVGHEIERTANPLVYKVHVRFGDRVQGTQRLLVWNLMQKWASANGTVPVGKVDKGDFSMTVTVALKNRLPWSKTNHPMDGDKDAHGRR